MPILTTLIDLGDNFQASTTQFIGGVFSDMFPYIAMILMIGAALWVVSFFMRH